MYEYTEKLVPTARRRIFIAVILGVLAGMGPLCTDLYLPALPAVAAYFNTEAMTMQLSLTSTLLGLAAGQILIGPLSDIWGRKQPLLISLAVFAVASLFCAAAPSSAAFIALRFLQGLAGAGGIVLSRTIACDLYRGTELTKFFSLLMLVNGIAPIFGPVLGGQILTLTDWRGIFLFLGTGSFFIAGIVCLGLKETLPPERRAAHSAQATLQSFAALLRSWDFCRYLLVQSFAMAGLFAYIAASPFVLQTIYGLSAEAFSVYFAVNGIGIMLAAQLAAKLSARCGERKILRCGLLLSLAASAATFLGSALLPGIWSVALPLFLVVACVGVTTTASFSLAIQAQQGSAGSASGILGVTSFLFGALASPLTGIIGGSAAWPMALVLVGANGAALGADLLRSAGKQNSRQRSVSNE